MSKKETLRGRDIFSKLYASGRRVDGELIRCLFLLENVPGPALLTGFAVSRRTCNAVRRNRLRRLMREAYRRERDILWSALQTSRCSASVLFVFKGKRDLPVERVTFSLVHRDIARLCRGLASKPELRRSCS